MLIPMTHDQGREEHGRILAELAHIAESGALKPVLDGESFELSRVAEALARLESGQAMGKVVVEN